MIYTIGHKESYEQYFREQTFPYPMKRGKCENYRGGVVFKTLLEALMYKPDHYEVYGVLADWETNTEESPGDPFNSLLKDSTLVKLL